MLYDRRIGKKYLDKRTTEIMLKYISMQNIQRVALTYQLTSSRIRQIRNKGLRIVREAYRVSRETEVFNVDTVLCNMAANSHVTSKELQSFIYDYIQEGLLDPENKKYWKQIPSLHGIPTPAELLGFLYENYQVEIEKRI